MQPWNKKEKLFKKANKRKEEELRATKSILHKSLSRVWQSFNRGKDLIKDEYKEMEIWVQEIKVTHGNYKMKKDLAKMNDPDYDSELSDSDQQFFTSSGRFNINQIKSSLNRYQSSQPIKDAYKRQNEYDFIETNNKLPLNPLINFQNSNNFNKTASWIDSVELTPNVIRKAKEAMTKTSLSKIVDSYSDSLIEEGSKKFKHTDNLHKFKSIHKGSRLIESAKDTRYRR